MGYLGVFSRSDHHHQDTSLLVVTPKYLILGFPSDILGIQYLGGLSGGEETDIPRYPV